MSYKDLEDLESKFFSRIYIARVIGCDRRSVSNYANYAFEILESFRSHSLTGDSYDHSSGTLYKTLNSRAPLTLYQFWVIKGIYKLFSKIPQGYNKKAIAESELMAAENHLTYDYFIANEVENFWEWIKQADPGSTVKKARTLSLVNVR